MRFLPADATIPGLDVEGLRDHLRTQPDVIAAYLFGSHAAGRPRPGSDMDIALLLDQAPAADDDVDAALARFDRRMELEMAIEPFVQGKSLDLIILNRAPILLQFQVLRHGYLLYEGDKKKRIDFEVRTVKHYYDWKMLHDRVTQVLRKDIREGRFGERKRHYQRTLAHVDG
ncbi:MAG: nucleotidyltransferase domain-containing protein [Chloroflexi bacterium]|nr:nucleotidyltransferase domain-containing protein [Chloroflexota bacterium]